MLSRWKFANLLLLSIYCNLFINPAAINCAPNVYNENEISKEDFVYDEVYEVKYIEQQLDHFDFTNNRTFQQRYLYDATNVKDNRTAPLFFFTGNEGDIVFFAQNTGFLYFLAREYNACLIWAEHRFYGKSIPDGNITANNWGFLNVEQALEDYAFLISEVWHKPNNTGPVIAFGGSYGGMLAAWIRMKYPHLVYAALASSAPVLQFDGLTECDVFYKIATVSYRTDYSTNCSENVGNSWRMFERLVATDEGRKRLNDLFKFCEPIKDEKDLDKFFSYLEEAYINIAMANYPYPTSFLAPLPGNPVKYFCRILREWHTDATLLNVMFEAISMYTNYTGKLNCFDYKHFQPNIGGLAWEIQTCTQMVMPLCANHTNTMFRDIIWDFKAYSDRCYEKYKLRPKLHDIIERYGGRNYDDVTNIIFSNGMLDPWMGGGVLDAEYGKGFVILILDGAHHVDLRAPSGVDPVSVIAARKRERKIITDWIAKFYAEQ